MYCFSWKWDAWNFLWSSVATATPETLSCETKTCLFWAVPIFSVFRDWFCMLILPDGKEYACMISVSRKTSYSPFPLLFKNRWVTNYANYDPNLCFRWRRIPFGWRPHVEVERTPCCLRLPVTTTNCLESLCSSSEGPSLPTLPLTSPHLGVYKVVSYNHISLGFFMP